MQCLILANFAIVKKYYFVRKAVKCMLCLIDDAYSQLTTLEINKISDEHEIRESMKSIR